MPNTTNSLLLFILIVLVCPMMGCATDNQSRFVVPHIKNTPEIDGQLAKAEWDRTAAVSGLASYFMDEVLAPSQQQATFFLAHDGTTIYLAMQATLPAGLYPKSVIPWHDAAGILQEGHIEWQILKHAPEEAQTSGKGFYKLSVNALGAILDEWRWGPEKQKNERWDAGATCETSVSEGIWTLELALPVQALGIKSLTGRQWRMQLVRADGNGNCYSEWGPGNWLQWKRFPTVVFADSGLSAQLRGVGRANAGLPDCNLSATAGENDKEVTAYATVRVPDGDRVLFSKEKTSLVPANASRSFRIAADDPIELPSAGAVLECGMRTPDRTLLRHRVKVRPDGDKKRKRTLAAWRNSLAESPPRKGDSFKSNPETFLGRLAAIRQVARPIQMDIKKAFSKNDLQSAARYAQQLNRRLPFLPHGHIVMARIHLLRQNPRAALKELVAAASRGGVGMENIRGDRMFRKLTDMDGFSRVIEAARNAPSIFPQNAAQPAKPDEGSVRVHNENIELDDRGVFRVPYDFSGGPPGEMTRWNHPAGKLLKQYHREGTAAGNWGDIYDNRDSDHSTLQGRLFPQLTFVEYSVLARAAGLHHGMPGRLMHDAVVIGNASLAKTDEDSWSSLPRHAYRNPQSVKFLYYQYIRNQLYCYPEHRDYDRGHNGEGGYGDVFFANTPYVVISKGSSGSDKPFLRAFAATLAAFRPETKKRLIENNLVAPALQMIMRRSLKGVNDIQAYLTGRAHRPVFNGKNLRPQKMVTKAHSIEPDALPPFVRLHIKSEGPKAVDAARERVFTTPSAVARVFRSPAQTRIMRISAEKSFDVNGRDLEWRWVLLQGDPERVDIKPLTKNGAEAKLTVKWHPRRPIAPGSKMQSNRVDVGVFAYNGKEWSPPAIISWYCPDNEIRKYSADGELLKRERVPTNYVDPALKTD